MNDPERIPEDVEIIAEIHENGCTILYDINDVQYVIWDEERIEENGKSYGFGSR